MVPKTADTMLTARMTNAATAFVASRWMPWALLVVSLGAHLGFSLLGADAFKLIDLRVYVDGTRHIGDGQLYEFFSGEEMLPFTYTPFAALAFWPLGALPWTVVALLWQLGCVLSLPVTIYLTLRLLGRAGPTAAKPVPHLAGILVTGTALAMWLEPVRSTFNYGQINLFLMVLLLAGAVTTRDWLAGTSVGIAAGIKLIPAITGLYYLLARRIRAVGWSIAVFALTVTLPVLLLHEQVWRYFSELIFDPARTGAVWVTRNQGWRGAIFRLVGHDHIALWLVAVTVSLVLGIWATAIALKAGDRCAALLAVQVAGLMISPISWSHHWVWVLPLLLWCLLGPARAHRPVKVIGWCWAASCFLFLVIFLIMLQNGHLETGPLRPLWESVLDSLYPALGIATLLVIARVPRQSAAVTAS